MTISYHSFIAMLPVTTDVAHAECTVKTIVGVLSDSPGCIGS
ncbi:hypothetical protein [Methanoregula sp.]